MPTLGAEAKVKYAKKKSESDNETLASSGWQISAQPVSVTAAWKFLRNGKWKLSNSVTWTLSEKSIRRKGTGGQFS